MAKSKENIIANYLSEVRSLHKTGQAREHAYRPAFKKLIEELNSNLDAINDPKQSEHGAPDFALFDKKLHLPIGYIETKDLTVSLDKVEDSEQMERYFGYNNLILTNYLEFRFYKNGEPYGESISIATLKDDSIQIKKKNFSVLEDKLVDFLSSPPQQVTSGKKLAKIMAGKAKRIRDNVKRFLSQDSDKNEDLIRVYRALQDALVHDLDDESFADMYAQTLVYGLFTARYYDDNQGDFSIQEARDLIPELNPFLQDFFNHILGHKFDKRLKFIVDELADVFSHTNVREILDQYIAQDSLWGSRSDGPDPVIHFYEDFLKEYDPELRKRMGAFYTPSPIVNFIVQSVDHVLKKDFDLNKGLANSEKDGNEHKVQILDPAVGTGTFLAEVLHTIYDYFPEDQKGRWPSYVFHDLLPRLHGFEIMMAPYTIAHLKLSMILRKTDFYYFNKRRLGIYLTNSLEPGVKKNLFNSSPGFGHTIAEEAKEASVIKEKTPIMVVLGNPPYSNFSTNKGDWIKELIEVYKKDLHEKKINLDDDYIKFIRLSEHFIERNGRGVVAMISNNSFIDGITHRQMRKHLLQTFDKIYILNLHGDSKKKETAPDGGKDENVFNIRQGVAIWFFIKTEEKNDELADVYHKDLYGRRKKKFKTLRKSSVETIDWQKISYREPEFYFIPFDYDAADEYEKGFKLDDLFRVYNSGIQTKRDDLTIHFNSEELEDVIKDLKIMDTSKIRQKYNLPKDGRDWKINWAKEDVQDSYKIIDILYRPFDFRKTAYSGNSKGFIAYPRQKTSNHFIDKDNIQLLFSRRIPTQDDFSEVFISNAPIDLHAAAGQTYGAPLYLYDNNSEKEPNLKKEILKKIKKVVGEIKPEDTLDYIYAVLHSPSYRSKYKDFLKTGFPHIPYPEDKNTFWNLVKKGKKLRKIHLLESSEIKNLDVTYPEEGSNIVEKYKFKEGKVWINDNQYFGNVPKSAWKFQVGGYQAARKWLKYRKDRELINEDIEHFQEIIAALVKTQKAMKEIDEIKDF